MTPQGWRDNFDINPEDRLFTKQKTTFSLVSYKKQGLMGVGVLGFVLILWFCFFSTPIPDHELPVIKAPTGPSKIKPPIVENQATSSHRFIYEKLGARSPDEKIEHLLKEPEEPLAASPTLPEGFMESFAEDDEGEKNASFAENRETPMENREEASLSLEDQGTKSTPVFLDEEEPEMPITGGIKDRFKKSLSDKKQPLSKSPPSAPALSQQKKIIPETVIAVPALTVTGSSVKSAPYTSITRQDKKLYWVQLASLKTHEAIEREWKRLSSLSRLKTLLGGLKPQYGKVDMGKKEGLQYRLRVGPFTQEMAKKLVHQLKVQKIDSIVKKG